MLIDHTHHTGPMHHTGQAYGTLRVCDAVSYVAAPARVGVPGEISVAGQIRLSGGFGTGMAAGALLPMANVMCADARTEATNGEWLRTPKFGTHYHSQRWRSAA